MVEWLVNPYSPLALLRQDVREFLSEFTSNRDELSNAESVITELVANVARHAHTEAHVELSWADGQMRLSVTDDGPGYETSHFVRPCPYAESRRGLWIVSQLADELKVERTKPHGTAVSARLRVGEESEHGDD